MTPLGQAHNYSHVFVVPADLGRATACRVRGNYRANVGQPTNGISVPFYPCDYASRLHVPFARTALHCGWCSEVQLTSCSVVLGRSSCVQYLADRSRERGRSTGILCGAFRRRNKMNKISGKTRTKVSVQHRAATASAFALPTWHAWRGRKRRNRTSHTSPASMRARHADGSPTITNRRPRCLASFSRRS
jgi:hypothetical protein